MYDPENKIPQPFFKVPDLYDKEVARVDALLIKQKNALKEQTGLKDFELEILSTTDNAQDDAYKKLLARAEKELKIDKKSWTAKEISRIRIPAPVDETSYCEKNWMPISKRVEPNY